ncbi:dolichol kinase [Halobacterium bonnevillei]|uniref:Dolichol kinase n=1 Tax=Halobacterium bonnevillei TaxID=2692200 RepID=A0A6B0SEZ2_9EURY|nr:dolichol kinase [Halobacterium bonnevillei]MXR20128.1 dolichol kinase [Halobacterium bonnevillei]
MSELSRRLVHASGAIPPLAYVADVVPWAAVQWLLVACSVVVVVLEALRLSGYVSWWIYDRLTREYEQNNPAGYALYVLSYAATVWVFDPAIAVPAVLMLALADPFSGYLSKGGLGRKRTWVLVATFGVCLAIATLLDVPPGAAAAGALAATIADGATPIIRGYVIDDNATIPLGAAAAMWLVTTLG